MAWFQLFLLVYVFLYADASCDTFRSACALQVGEAANSGNTLLLANRGTLFLTLTPTSSTPSIVQLVASVLYGRVEFYATLGDKEPSPSSYDLSSALSGSPDLLSIVSSFLALAYFAFLSVQFSLPSLHPHHIHNCNHNHQ